jgi:hypothetical protein
MFMKITSNIIFPKCSDSDEENGNQQSAQKAWPALAETQDGSWYLPKRRNGVSTDGTASIDTIYGSTEKSPEWDKVFKDFPKQFIEHVYERHKRKIVLFDIQELLLIFYVSLQLFMTMRGRLSS